MRLKSMASSSRWLKALGVPGDDAESLVGVRYAPVEHLRLGPQGIAGIDGLLDK